MIINPIESALKRLVQTSDKTAASKLEAAVLSPAKNQSIADQLQLQFRARQFSQTNMALVVPSDPDVLIALVKQGQILPSEHTALTFENVTSDVQLRTGKAAVVLSNSGKQDLARAAGASILDSTLSAARSIKTSKGLSFGEQTLLSRPVDLMPEKIKFVLVDEKDYPSLMQKYADGVQKNELPAKIAGKPYSEFFRSSDDLYNDLEVEAFQRAVPGFVQRSTMEQKSVAAMANRVANEFPAQVDADIRRRVAAALVQYRSLETPGQDSLTGELRTFYHGTRAGEQIAREGFRLGPRAMYGTGIYYANPTAASGFALEKEGLEKGADLLSGHVAVGEVTVKDFDLAPQADSRFITRTYPDGDYWITQDPKRFRVKAITSYRPEQTAGLEKLIPDLMLASLDSPKWAAGYLDRIASEQLKRSLEHSLSSGNRDMRFFAASLLAKQGDLRGLPVMIETIRSGSTAEIRAHAAQSLLETKELSLEQTKAVQKAFDSTDSEVRHQVGIRRVGSDKAFYPHALDALKNGSTHELRAEAGLSLLKTNGLSPEQNRAVMNVLKSAPSEVRHRVGIQQQTQEEPFFSWAIDALKNNQASAIQKQAVLALEKATASKPGLRPAFVDTLATTSADIRHSLVDIMLAKHHPLYFPFALDALQNGANSEIRVKAGDFVAGMFKSLTPEQQQISLDALTAAEAEVRHTVSGQVAYDPRFFPFAMDALTQSANPKIRNNAAMSLAFSNGLAPHQENAFAAALAEANVGIYQRWEIGINKVETNPRFFSFALDALQNGPSKSSTPSEAAFALSKAHLNPQQKQAFKAILDASDAPIRHSFGIKKLTDDPSVFPHVMDALTNGTPYFKDEAAKSLSAAMDKLAPAQQRAAIDALLSFDPAQYAHLQP